MDSYIETFDIQDFRKVLDVNLVGKVICTKHAIPLLKNSENASIVNIASRLGYESIAHMDSALAKESSNYRTLNIRNYMKIFKDNPDIYFF